ncbi:hypothetical protein PUR71_14430 [Streptomyces sp. SP17BM10]|uniref:hypothetical protein n=1 Tax=Streptomyces sp. SP17BM10 TaxID=3002530 RepID=UPI002E780D0D|nr:hypothetical protein [Streptomyces sp. SP17BM10]MEE1784085.1 hypothetical protein [Streptomyces sp. SP17BM10]
MAETHPTSSPAPSTAAAVDPSAAAKPADAAVADAAANVAGYIVPADEKHADPQELMGGDAVEPAGAETADGKPYEPLGAINSRP